MIARLHRRGRLSNFWDYLRTSFWFVPALMILFAIPLLWGGISWESDAPAVPQVPWWVYVSKADAAREVLSTILSSMIAMASLVFSITMVVLTLAANQFGPRLVRNFMASPQTQFVLGTFVMTIAYCILALSFVGRRESTAVLPFPTVSIALLLTLLSTVVLVAFIHSLARSIVSETVIDRVGGELDAIIEGLEPLSSDAAVNSVSGLPVEFDRDAIFFGLNESGYVQAVEFDTLLRIATRSEVVIGLSFRAGDYLVEGGRTVGVNPRERVTDGIVDEIRHAIFVGVHRTPVQDLEFSIRHLVEIAVRALSPGVNDPYTAVAVLDQLSASLSRLMARKLPTGMFCDDAAKTRVVCPAPTYESLLGAAFNQIRQSGGGTPVVAIHMIEAIGRIGQRSTMSSQVEPLLTQLSMIGEAAESGIAQLTDRADIRARYDQALLTLERGRR